MGGGPLTSALEFAAKAGLRGIISDHSPLFSSGADEDSLINHAFMMPRVIFGDAPTLQEAKDATSELTVALERTYLSSMDSNGSNGSYVFDHTCNSFSDSVSSQLTNLPSVPVNAINAFVYLHDSPGAQAVVASIACDPNVWNAVLQNRELQVFLQSQGTSLAGGRNVAPSSDDAEAQADGGILEIIDKVKIMVVDMMSSLYDYFETIFGGQESEQYANSNGRGPAAENQIGASFMGLTVMVILLILLRRVNED